MSQSACCPLFDSARFVVVYHKGDDGRGEGVEIADKQTEQSLYLYGDLWRCFDAQVNAWKTDVPSESEVEEYLSRYLQLATHRLIQH